MPEPELPSQRRWREELAAQESAHGVQWQDWIDTRTRRLILAAFDLSFSSGGATRIDEELYVAIAEFVDLHAEISVACGSWHDAALSEQEWEGVPTLEYLDWLQAASICLDRRAHLNGVDSDDHEYAFKLRYDGQAFRDRVNDIFLDRRVNYVFVGAALVGREEEPLHASIIEPVSALLSSDSRFAAAERAYGEAPSHLAGHQAGPSITSAGSAVAEVMRALGARGNDLGTLFADSRSRGFLQGHDDNLFQAYRKIVDWVTANRSNRGNAHWATSGDRADALLACRVAGSLILRLIALAGTPEPEAEGTEASEHQS